MIFDFSKCFPVEPVANPFIVFHFTGHFSAIAIYAYHFGADHICAADRHWLPGDRGVATKAQGLRKHERRRSEGGGTE